MLKPATIRPAPRGAQLLPEPLAIQPAPEAPENAERRSQELELAAIKESPPTQEIALIAFGKKVDGAPPAYVVSPSRHFLGITCWDLKTRRLPQSWAKWSKDGQVMALVCA